ncbi:D-arabitol-phosphate dehydrogenase [compost metagenome]|uniref:L-iditol 2-dehydrogenase n=1 Tax=Clostridium intestinale DSM 6191 TaxID=1121320 RepID=A0A1M5YIK1_9CLOT|nr:zinc-binding dehydrogenase [Clostridium intestinale]WRY51121.1 zinc-binding dehydrogenase [Clostridium intestinale]SHI11846.1 L-iditol 2-dehydrogenase [Clostridium intestinale DSM 6191]
MKALTKTEKGYDKMALLDIEEPKAEKNLVKIKVEYSGICGSDLHSFKGEYGNIKTPVVLGHEFSGVVVEVGESVTKVKVGDRVTSETTFETCGECDFCKSKDYNLCSTRKGIGTQANGSFAEYVLSREESVHVLPENVSLLAASLTEPLACCVHAALEKTTINAGEVALVFGPGPIGLLLSQVVKSQGAYVILAGVTKDKERMELAKKLGIDLVVDLLQEDLDAIVMEKTNGYGANKVFDCSGVIHAVNQGLRLTKKKGDFVQVGLFAKVKNELDQEAIIQREIRYIGSRSQKPSSWITSLELLRDKKVDTETLVTKMVDLENWRDGIDAAMQGSEIKVVIKS